MKLYFDYLSKLNENNKSTNKSMNEDYFVGYGDEGNICDNLEEVISCVDEYTVDDCFPIIIKKEKNDFYSTWKVLKSKEEAQIFINKFMPRNL